MSYGKNRLCFTRSLRKTIILIIRYTLNVFSFMSAIVLLNQNLFSIEFFYFVSEIIVIEI